MKEVRVKGRNYMKHLIQISEEQCIGCGACVKDCPAKQIYMKNGKASLHSQSCIKCGHCVAICPKAAVSMSGYKEEPISFESKTTLSPKELLDALRARRSIRQFLEKEVPTTILEEIIEAGRITPTAKNAQDVSYVVLQEKKVEAQQIAVAMFQRLLPMVKLFMKSAKHIKTIEEHFFFFHAPVVIVVVSDQAIDGALAASNMALMAEAHGLGVLYSGFFTIAANHSKRLKKLLGLQKKEKVVTTLVLGYPAVRYHRSAQREPASVRYL